MRNARQILSKATIARIGLFQLSDADITRNAIEV